MILTEISGITMCRILKNEMKTKDVTAVIMTAPHDEDTEIEGLEEASYFMKKSIDGTTILETVNELTA